ncbi:MAG TPA: glycosyltransferase, partial [Actinomycetota bacterium]|nr:glycosyltransferase [Actinomycetota bacterium]
MAVGPACAPTIDLTGRPRGARLTARIAAYNDGAGLYEDREDDKTMAGNRLRFSVVVCAYTERRWDDLVAAVASLKAQTDPPFEIILSIDHNPELYARA